MDNQALPGSDAVSEPAGQNILAALDRVLASPPFEHCDRLGRFLRFVVEKTLEGKGGDIKEFLIATEVYKRSIAYDPKVDSTVRVEASRLRTKLREYYESHGQDEPVRIELPKGSYVPLFRLAARPPAEITEAPSDVPEPPPVVAAAPRATPLRLALLLIALFAVAFAVLFVYSRRTVNSPAMASEAANITSVAVLPFLSLGDAPGQQAFADGLTEDITESLARVKEVRVAGRASASRFKGKAENIPVLGRQMNVGSIIDGSVRQDGARIRVTAQLISTADGFHLWSATYDRPSSDKLALQTELSETIGRAVAGALAGASSRFAKQLLTAPEQVELFRKGIQLLDWRYDHILLRGAAAEQPQPLSELMQAIDYFEQLVARNSGHARGWAALAHTYLRAAEYDPRLSQKARSSAENALRLDAGIGAAHGILGYGYFLKDWEFRKAEIEFRRALDLDPRLLGIYRLYGDCASLFGHQAEALAVVDRGRAAFPGEPLLRIARALLLYHSRRYAEMADDSRALLAADPNTAAGHWLLGLALEQLGQQREAAAEFQTTLRTAEGDPRALTALGHVYGRLGRREDALDVVSQFTRRSQHVRPAYSIAMIYAGLGDREAAISWLQQSFERHETSTPYMKLDPRFDTLRSDPRFAALLARMNL